MPPAPTRSETVRHRLHVTRRWIWRRGRRRARSVLSGLQRGVLWLMTRCNKVILSVIQAAGLFVSRLVRKVGQGTRGTGAKHSEVTHAFAHWQKEKRRAWQLSGQSFGQSLRLILRDLMQGGLLLTGKLLRHTARLIGAVLAGLSTMRQHLLFILQAPVRLARQFLRFVLAAAALVLALARLSVLVTLIIARVLGEAILWAGQLAWRQIRPVFLQLQQLVARFSFYPVTRLAYGLFIVMLGSYVTYIITAEQSDTRPQSKLAGAEIAELEAPAHTSRPLAVPAAELENPVKEPAVRAKPVPRKSDPRQVMADRQRKIPPPRQAVVGRQPETSPSPAWQRFAVSSQVAFSSQPKLVIVIDDLGLSKRASRRLETFKGPLTLAFLPYAHGLPDQTRRLKQAGHELLVHMPMEPRGTGDPGYQALLSGLDQQEFDQRLAWNLSRFSGFVGINNHMGSALTENTPAMDRVMAALNERGLLFLDSLTSADSQAYEAALSHAVPALKRDVFLDNERDRDLIAAQLRLAVDIARRTGSAIAIGHPYPETLDVLERWNNSRDKGAVQLVSLGALMMLHESRKLRLAEASESASR